MTDLDILKDMIDEAGYPTYEDEYLLSLISAENANILDIAKTLLIKKAAIPDIKLGDVEIKSPRAHYMLLLSQLRRKVIDENGNIVTRAGSFKTVGRADGT